LLTTAAIEEFVSAGAAGLESGSSGAGLANGSGVGGSDAGTSEIVDAPTPAISAGLTEAGTVTLNTPEATLLKNAPPKTTAPALPKNIFQKTGEKCQRYWHRFWQNTAFVDFSASTDKRAPELQRRIVLSQYLLRIHCLGELPPQETGLFCNSWYGKFHLEMHPWHLAYLALWNGEKSLRKHLRWYQRNKAKARENAAKNGYAGYRWPKMIGVDAVDSPSIIAPLLVWQQVHIVYMLELIYQKTKSQTLLHEFWDIVKGTVDFICDFLVFQPAKGASNTSGSASEEAGRAAARRGSGTYNLCPPIMPCQEEFDPTEVVNPTFEIAYFKFGLALGKAWAERLGMPNARWEEVHRQIALPTIKDGLYLAHQNCPQTYTDYLNDHPTQLAIFSFFDNPDIDRAALENTLNKVLTSWNQDSMWGWDYGYMAMAACRLGKMDLAMDILLKECPKNYYAQNGNNFQKGRSDLPAYFPGNGALLLTVAVLASREDYFKREGSPWRMEHENLAPFPWE
jgi:hypothetical protein